MANGIKRNAFEYNAETQEAKIDNRGESIVLKSIDFKTAKKIADFAEAVARQARKDRSIEIVRKINKLSDDIYE